VLLKAACPEVRWNMEYVPVDKEICCVANLIRREIDNYSFENFSGVERITRMNVWIIEYIYKKGGSDVFQKDLEKELSITRSTASKVIDLMEQKGLIEKSSVDYDARLKKLSLTSKAVEFCAEMERISQIVYDKVMKGFTKEEEEVLRDFMKRIKKNMT